MLKVLIADDHAIVRQGLRQILGEIPELSEVAEVDNGQDALNRVRAEPWDVLVLDMSMPGRGGLDILKDVHRERPETRVLVLSMHPEDQFAVRMLKAGASGYLTKDSAAEQLVGAIRKIAAGGVHISEAAAAGLVAAQQAPHQALSDREFEVMRLLVGGLGPTEIGEQLHLSVKTVSTHKARILEKLNLGSTAELVRYAMENKILP